MGHRYGWQTAAGGGGEAVTLARLQTRGLISRQVWKVYVILCIYLSLIIDHIIMGDKNYLSLKREGLF